MRSRNGIPLLTTLVVILLAGCSEPDSTDSDLLGNESDPCSIALTYTLDDTSSISRIQQKAENYLQHPAYLERLGWKYVDAARSKFDPGFLTQADFAAQCLEQIPNQKAAALLLRSHVLHQQHRFNEAVVLAGKLVEMRGHWFDYAVLGDALLERGDIDLATVAYQHMADLRPGPQAYARSAHLRWLTGDVDGALEMMRRAVRSTSPANAEASAWMRSRLAAFLWQQNETDEALQVLESALNLQMDYPPALLLHGRMHLVAGNVSEAVDVLARATTLNPLPEYQWAYAEALERNGMFSAANDIATQLVRHGESTDARTLSLYLASVSANKDIALRLARKEYDKRSDPLTADALAWALLVNGQIDEARKYSRLAIQSQAAEARIYYHAAVIAKAAGEFDEAFHLRLQATKYQHMLLPSEREHLIEVFAAQVADVPVDAKQAAASFISLTK